MPQLEFDFHGHPENEGGPGNPSSWNATEVAEEEAFSAFRNRERRPSGSWARLRKAINPPRRE